MSDAHQLDTSGLLCPLPVIRTQDAVKGLQAGDRLTITATDPGARHDIPAWVRVHGHILLRDEAIEDAFVFEIEVRDS